MTRAPRVGPLLGRGAEADVYELADGMVLRVPRSSAAGDPHHQILAMATARRHGASAPAFYELVDHAGREALVLERLDPEHLLDRLGRRPWTVVSVGLRLGRMHARMHGISAGEHLLSVHEIALQRLAASSLSPQRRRAVEHQLDALPRGHRLHHGDFNPANVLRRDGRAWVTIDWAGSAKGDPAADVARTLRMIRRGQPPLTTPWFLMRLNAAGRAVLEQAYVRGYRSIGTIDAERTAAWIAVWDEIERP